MKFVVACCWAPDKGQGISTISREIAACLAQNGDDVYYLSPRTDNIDWYKKLGIKPIFIGHDLAPKQGLKEIVQILNELRPDAIINNDHPYVQSSLPALISKKIIISHTMAWSTASLVLFNHRYADNIITISYDMLQRLLKKGVSPIKLSFAMNGIVDPYQANWLPKANLNSPISLFFAGSWTTVKGADLILDFILSMPDHITWLKLDIFGGIKQKHINKISKKSWVKVHGRVPHTEFMYVLEKADILLLPSKVEGCPMTVIEAMSRGVIPIVSDGLGSMKWMVDHGIDGYVVRRRSWQTELMQIIEYMNINREFLYQMKCQARSRFIRQFDINHLIRHIKSLIEQPSKAEHHDSEGYQVLKWHRPLPDSNGLFNKIISRINYKLGLLKTSGWINKNEFRDIENDS